MAFDPLHTPNFQLFSSRDKESGRLPRESLQSTPSMDDEQKSGMNDLEASEPEESMEPGNHEDLEKRPTAQDKQGDGAAIRVVTAQDWIGPEDPENPHNWPMWKRCYHCGPPALIALTMTFGSSVYTPGSAEVAADFNVSRTVSLLPLSLWVMGLACGPMIAAPISETYGRNVVYRVSVPIALLFTLGAGFSNNIGSLLVLRFLAGTAGSPILAVGGGTFADLFPPKQRAISSTWFLLSAFLGPALGPFIGGFVAQYKDWRWTQWTIIFFGTLAFILSLPMEETYKKIILQRRAKKLGIAPPPDNLPTTPLAYIKFILTVTLLRPVHMLFLEPIVLFLSLYTAFTFSILFAFLAGFPYIFQRPPYLFSISQSGLIFLAIAIGVLIAGVSAIIIDRTTYQRLHAKATAEGRANVAPEHRLYAAMVGSFCIPVGLFWFAWTADRGVHWAVLAVATIPFAFGNLSIFISTALYIVDVYGPLNGSSALAANGIARYMLGAIFPLFTVQMYRVMGVGWAISLLGFVSVAMLPIPWVLFKWGPKIRASSHYETTKF